MFQRKLADRYGESQVVRRSWYQAQPDYMRVSSLLFWRTLMIHTYAHGAVDDVVTECFKREMTRPAGAPTKIYAPPAWKYDGVGGFAKNSSRIPISGWIDAVCFIAVLLHSYICYLRQDSIDMDAASLIIPCIALGVIVIVALIITSPR